MASKQTMKKMLPIGLAVAAGGLLLWFTQRKANAGQLPPPPDGGGGGGQEPSGGGGGGQEPSGGGGGGPSGGGGSSVNAPPFQARTSAANNAIDAYYSEWLGALGVAMDANGNPGPATMDEMRAAKAQLGIPSSRTPSSWFTDQTIDYVYGMAPGSIPDGFNSTWQPWVNEWNRIYNRFRSQPLDPTA